MSDNKVPMFMCRNCSLPVELTEEEFKQGKENKTPVIYCEKCKEKMGSIMGEKGTLEEKDIQNVEKPKKTTYMEPENNGNKPRDDQQDAL